MPNVTVPQKPTVLPMAIIGGLFFIFGFVTWLNGPLITFVKLAFTLDDFDAFLVPMAFYMSYFIFSLPAAFLLRRTGLKAGMSAALLVMSIGALIFGQFATARMFPQALAGLFIIGAGLSILQTASNPYISILGPLESAARRIAFMGICNKLAGILAPIVIGQIVLSGISGFSERVTRAPNAAAREVLLNEFAARIHQPYQAMAAILAVLSVAIFLSPLPDVADTLNINSSEAVREPGWLSPRLLFGFFAIFFYIGVEVMAGDAIGTYGRSFNLPLDQAKFFTSFTLVAMLVGYAAGLFLIPRTFSQERYLGLSAILGILLTVGAFLTKGYISVGFVGMLGFANAMMWPAIFPLGIRGFGRKTEIASAVLVMGIVGGAVIPQMFAWLKGLYDFQVVFLGLMVPSYLYILFFSWFAGQERKGV